MHENKLYKIGNQVKKARLDAGMTYDGLATEVEISPTYLRAIEAGSKCPSHELLIKIIKATQKEANFFYSPYVVVQKEPDELDLLLSSFGDDQRETAAKVLKAIYPDEMN